MKKMPLVVILFIFITIGLSIGYVRSAEAPRITKEDLKAVMGNPDWIIIDVRYGKDWTNSNLKIKGAIREDPDSVDSWANKYSKEKNIVLYCA